jgi:hypothetical protein
MTEQQTEPSGQGPGPDDQRLQQALANVARKLVEVRKFDSLAVSLAMMAVAIERLHGKFGAEALAQYLGRMAVGLHSEADGGFLEVGGDEDPEEADSDVGLPRPKLN